MRHMKKLMISNEEMVSPENLLLAWQEFVCGKRYRRDVLEYERFLTTNLLKLHKKLVDGSYRHGKYTAFTVSDPKTRHIHKATVEDRVVHRILYRALYAYCDSRFISDSFSCREGKGTHRALDRFFVLARTASQNHSQTVWILQCDIRKFFASIDHGVLLRFIGLFINDPRILRLIEVVVSSFCSGIPVKGLPLGNLTSQLFANIYMNELDRFVKHRLRARHYMRYADDFVIMSADRKRLMKILPHIDSFLSDELCLTLHPDKVHIKTLASGVDFLGWVHFPDHRVLRTKTRQRVEQGMVGASYATRASYLGLLKHGNTRKLTSHLFGIA